MRDPSHSEDRHSAVPRDEAHEELSHLDRVLEAIRFTPRPSLAAEIFGRLRRAQDDQAGGRRRSPSRFLIWGGLAATAAYIILSAPWTSQPALRNGGMSEAEPVRLDRCCEDLDGGGIADDGLLVLAQADETVLRIAIYEDRDGSRDFSAGDVLRAGPGGTRVAPGPLPAGAISSDHCCNDYDGGGPADDGIFLIGLPPDRIILAALYEDRDESRNVSAADLVRYMLP